VVFADHVADDAPSALSVPHSRATLPDRRLRMRMAIFILLGLQAAAALADPAIPADFDLRKLPVHEDPLDVTGSRDCRSSDDTEIVVCGRRGGEQRYRLRTLPDGDYPVRAEMGAFGNSRVAVEADSVTMGEPERIMSVRVSQRAMIRLKTPF
jgi:hypothetical protein